MKRRIFSILFALVLVLSMSLVTAVPVMANSVASSTMHFEGTLVPDGNGGYTTTTIPMTAGEYYVSGGGGAGIWTEGGFDVYAKEGGTAYVQGMTPDNWPIGSDHDAYSEAGPWGSWYDPDVADWELYSLELTTGHWYLRYTSTGESPMSGTIVWNGDGKGYASETDPGTVKVDHGGTTTDPMEYLNGAPQEWGWWCGWGEERIPLEHPGFEVVVVDLGSGNYHVTLTPAEPTTTVGLTTDVKGILGIRVNPTEIDFGSLYPGQTSPKQTITVANIGTVSCDVDAWVDSPAGTVFDHLTLTPPALIDLVPGGSSSVDAQLVVPPDYPPGGIEKATLIFEVSTP